MRIWIGSVIPWIEAGSKIPAQVWKALQFALVGFHAERRPPKSPCALIAQNSQEGSNFEKANNAGDALHIVYCKRIKSGLRDLKRARRFSDLVLPPRP